MDRDSAVVAPARAAPPAVARRVSPGLILGLGLVACALIFAGLTWERWLPATPVRVAQVVAIPAATGTAAAPAASAATPLFQAAGWVEADPQPVRATALVGGVVAEVLVLEGQRVAAGQVLARLDPTDHELDVAAARARRDAAAARLAAAREQVAGARAEVAELEAQLAAADARIAERRDLAQRLAASERAFSQRQREEARLALATAEAERAALAAQAPVRAAAVGRAEAGVALATAELAAQTTALERAELDLERTAIRAPIDGVIAHLHASPGRKQLLGMDDPKSTTVAELYDPARLQARIDVPLADAARLAIGQRVELQTEALPDATFGGEVTRIVGAADIARNTVQAKVRIHDPADVLRPDMLVRARFFGRGGTRADEAASGTPGLRLVLDAAAAPPESELELWVVDEHQRAARRAVRTGSAIEPDGVRVLAGLGAGELVVLDPPGDLAPGERLAIEEVVE